MANQTDTEQLALWGISFGAQGWVWGGNRRLSPGTRDLSLRPVGVSWACG